MSLPIVSIKALKNLNFIHDDSPYCAIKGFFSHLAGHYPFHGIGGSLGKYFFLLSSNKSSKITFLSKYDQLMYSSTGNKKNSIVPTGFIPTKLTNTS